MDSLALAKLLEVEIIYLESMIPYMKEYFMAKNVEYTVKRMRNITASIYRDIEDASSS